MLSEVKERNRELRTQINILQNRVSTIYQLCSTTCVAHIILPNSDRGVGDGKSRSKAGTGEKNPGPKENCMQIQ